MWLPPRAVPLLFPLLLVVVSLAPGPARAAAPCVAMPTLTKDVSPGASGSGIPETVEMNRTLFFAANDGVSGAELWKSDGTPVGTELVKAIRPGATEASLHELTTVDGRLYFLAYEAGLGGELWKSDGTTGGTVMLKSFPNLASASSAELTAVGNTLFFVAEETRGDSELWMSDGTPAGTKLVKDIKPGPDGSFPQQLRALGSQLFFRAEEPDGGNELWKSDGTAPGTVRVKDIAPGPAPSNPSELTIVGQTLFFLASSSLWRSDGTEAGTVIVQDFGALGASTVQSFTAVGNMLFFQLENPSHGAELWKSDGTQLGTALVKDIQQGIASSSPQQLTAVGSTLFFVANDGAHGEELWKSDGTAAGTRLVKDIAPGEENPGFGLLAPGPGVLLMQVDDGQSGSEPWRSDGTAEGTYRLADLEPQAGASTPRDFRLVGTHLFFVARKSASGEELFVVSLQAVDCTPPTLSCSSRVNIEAISGSGTLLTHPPVGAVDDALYGLWVAFEPSPGLLPLGTTPVRVAAHDQAGNVSYCDFDIVVSDTTKPLLLCPDAMEQEATGPAGAEARYFVVANDAVTEASRLAVQYEPLLGSDVAVGTTSVRVTATDAAGNSSTCSFPFTVRDTTPPRLSCPRSLFQVITRPEELTVNYSVRAEDAASTPQLTINHPPGSLFPLGETAVSVQARDVAGNTSQCTFQVTLVDPQGPSISCPGTQYAQASGGEGAVVNFPEATATDNAGSPTVSYSHAPGSTFPEGQTEVTATATDVAGQSESCTFTVRVERGPGAPSGSSCQAGPWGGSVAWLLWVLIPLWARRGAVRLAR